MQRDNALFDLSAEIDLGPELGERRLHVRGPRPSRGVASHGLLVCLTTRVHLVLLLASTVHS